MKINCDLGEGLPDIDATLIPLIDQVSIACGAHAGDETSMRNCIRLATLHNTDIGIHPSYPDRENFGRLSMAISASDLAYSLREQIQKIPDLCKQEGAVACYVKPHGALYNDLAYKPDLLVFFLDLVSNINKQNFDSPPLAAMISASLNTELTRNYAKKLELPIWFEAFADRAYNEDGSLLSRKQANALHTDPEKILAQYNSLATRKGVYTATNTWLDIQADSVCFHGDNPGAQLALQKLKSTKSNAH